MKKSPPKPPKKPDAEAEDISPAAAAALLRHLEQEREDRIAAKIAAGEAIQIDVYVVRNWAGEEDVEVAKAAALARHGDLGGRVPIFNVTTIVTCTGVSEEPQYAPVPWVPSVAPAPSATSVPIVPRRPPARAEKPADLHAEIAGAWFDEPGGRRDDDFGRKLHYGPGSAVP